MKGKKVKSFSSHMAHRAALISVSMALSETSAYAASLPDHGYGASASRGVSVYSQLSLVLVMPPTEGWPG